MLTQTIMRSGNERGLPAVGNQDFYKKQKSFWREKVNRNQLIAN